ncbi:SpoIID/LytB domain-containing protein [Aceticella autotrophica]|uniref:SpoIID/LytB domain-containing protein n=1 Tax=Aceticella autotrophica TaxID=2755338 RepID=A0A975AUK7_9THEO|nr:SpoIID/LytB domain-containing protein [Aceticella autotrophica]QSZ26732.1 SpoIID/LytB domain-containing protein [Aceticella autotrophica]
MSFKKIAAAVLVCAIILSILPFGDVNADVHLPSLIRIGLYYASSAKAVYQLSSESGYKIAYQDNNGNIKYIYNINAKDISINKDDNFYLMAGTYNDQAGVDDALSKITLKVPNSLVGYDGNYHIFIGPYTNQNDASLAMKAFAVSYSDIKLVKPDVNISILQNNKNIFLFCIKDFMYISKISTDPTMLINSKAYRGIFGFKRQTGSDMTAINVLTLEEYLYGVVPSEMPASWNIEALKAQAVASRTYAAKNTGKYSKYGFDLTDDVFCQVYKGYSNEYSNSNRAVDATKGVVAIYKGSLIDALFHSHSGGFTEDSENYFDNDVPYLKAVEDKYVFGYNKSDDRWSVNFSKDQIKQKLLCKKQDIGDIVDIKVTGKSWTGRATEVTLYGTNGNYVLRKSKIRDFFDVKSTMLTIDGIKTANDSNVYIQSNVDTVQKVLNGCYVVTANGTTQIKSDIVYLIGQNGIKQINNQKAASDVYIINGSGNGHGIGLSQYGARGMADNGYNYIDILKYYYKGIDLFDTINNKTL